MKVDWESLRGAAREAAGRAYAPYSGFPVGAAGLTSDGRVVSGCNVENASYGLGLCAECGVVAALHGTAPAAGARPALVAVVVVDGQGEPLMPCGGCRQLLHEHGGPGLLLATAGGVRSLAELLPDAFDAPDLRGPAARDRKGPGWTRSR